MRAKVVVSAFQCRVHTNSAAHSAVSNHSGRSSSTAASASASMAMPFHAVTTLSSRSGGVRCSRCSHSSSRMF
ncbi:hypothetical protein [Kocuria atrinae]|uniref:hypothetical protein n=1 Tax=Kocuria atrinae TaxID=592377 RepID=UPI0037BEF1F7